MSEKEYLLSKISQVAGQINRHKNQQDGSTTAQSYPSRYGPYPYNYTSTRGMPSYRTRGGRGRGGRGGSVWVQPVHRNKTLVLNTNAGAAEAGLGAISPTSAQTVTASSFGPITTAATPQPGAGSGPQWIAKRDRHRQIINSAVYDQQAVARTKAMEATRQAAVKRKSERQRLKLKAYLEKSQNVAYSSNTQLVTVGGIKYQVSAGGNKLVKLSDDARAPAAAATPRRAVIGGVTFLRSKSGNLWRSGLIRSQHSTLRKMPQACKYFTMTGQCQRGMSCPFTHDPNRVAICPRFLQSDNCPEGEACDLSHDPTPNRVPACVHFLRGNCSNPNCRYAHIRVNPAAAICRPFATVGYCEKGGDCTERHVHECPDFDEKGQCTDRKCKLPHIERAGRRRMAAAAAAAAGSSLGSASNPGFGGTDNHAGGSVDGGEDSDFSSDEDGEGVDFDDVDSDALSDEDKADQECFINIDAPKDNSHELKHDLDFIEF